MTKEYVSKNDIFNEVANNVWIKKNLIEQIFDEIENVSIKYLKKNKEVKLWNWKLVVKELKPKYIISIKDWKKIKTKKKKVIKFILKDSVRNILNNK